MEKVTCKSCKFFVTNKCVRYPPQIYADVGQETKEFGADPIITTYHMSEWPDVEETDWCGEYKAMEPEDK